VNANEARFRSLKEYYDRWKMNEYICEIDVHRNQKKRESGEVLLTRSTGL